MNKKKKNLLFRILASIVYIILTVVAIYLLIEKGHRAIIGIYIPSIPFFICPFLSFFFPKKLHHWLYKFGEKLIKYTYAVPDYEPDNYKKWPKFCLGFLIFADILAIVAILDALI